jgi:1-acyl-sn-glycerol-3-phosphate acyltransferase
MLLLRAVVFYFGYALATMLVGSLCLFTGLLPRAIGEWLILRRIDFVLFWLGLCCGISVKVSGNIDSLKSPSVVVSNHQSNWKAFFFQQYFTPLCTILKKELLNIPFFG